MKTNRKEKGMSLVALVITIVVTIILAFAVILTYKNNRADKQAKEVNFKTNLKSLENELYTYIADQKIEDANTSVKVNSTDENIDEILPSAQKFGLKESVIVCNGKLVFKEDSNLSDEEKNWASEMYEFASSCDDFNSETEIGVTLSVDGGILNIEPDRESTKVETVVNLANENYSMQYAFSNSNFVEPGNYINIASGQAISEQKSGGTYYIWIKVYDELGKYLGKYISSPFIVRYKVVYDANGGTGAPSEQYKNYMSPLMISTTKPTREGYEFVGWATSQNSNQVSYYAGQEYSTDRAVRLYAVYKTDRTSMLVVEEQENVSSTYYGRVDEQKEVSDIPTKPYYVFNGWNFSGSGSFNHDTKVYTFGTGIGTLKATWIEAVCMIEDDFTFYASLADAVRACGNYSTKTIKLLKNITVDSTVNVGSSQNINLNLNNRVVTSNTSGVMINNSGILKVYSGAMNSNYEVIRNTGRFTITSGTIDSTNSVAIVNNQGSVTVGTDDGSVSTSVPAITGGTYGISGNISFYDGVISGKTAAFSGSVVARPTNYKVKYTTSGSYKQATLTNYYTLSISGSTGGTVSGSKGEIKYSTRCSVTATPLEGYKFLGWYEGNTRVSSSQYYTFNMPARDYYLVAKFTTEDYNLVIQSSGGGSVSGSSGSVSYLSSCNVTATPYEGYSFDGWYEGSTLVSSSASYSFTMPARNLTLTARFSTNSYTLNVTATEGGTITGTRGIVSYGQRCSVTATPTEGYTFSGWYENGQCVSTNANYVFNMPARSRYLVAQFGTNSYTFSLVKDFDGTRESGGVVAAPYGASIDLKTANSYSGYSFDGWYEGNTRLSTSLTYTITMPARSLAITEKYTKNSYTLALDKTEGGNVSGGGSKKYLEACTVSATPLEGYTFSGWYEGSTLRSQNANYSFTMPAGNLTLTAKFGKGKYNLSINATSGGTVSGSSGSKEYGESCEVVATPNTGNSFYGWYSGTTQVSTDATYKFTMPKSDLSLTAKFDADGYMLSRTAETGGSVSGDSGIFKYGVKCKVSAAASEGYSFEGWYNGSSKVSSTVAYEFDMPAKDYALVAKFKKNSYKLTLTNTSGGSVSGSSGDIVYDTQCQVTAKPDSGYVLEGWYDGTSRVSTSTTYSFKMPAKNYNLQAKFEVKKYTLSVTAGTGGKVSGDSGNKDYNVSCTVKATPNSGYTFKGWYNGTAKVSSDSSYTFKMPANDYSIKAEFTPASYTLTVNAETGGTVSGDKGSVAYGKSCAVTATPMEGYNFSGWYVGSTLKSSSASYTFNMPASNLTLTAKFTKKSYTLTIKAETGGSVSGSKGSIAQGSSCTVLATPSTGYEFTGWYEGTTLKSSSASYTFNMPTYNLTLTAKFAAKKYTYTVKASSGGTVSPSGSSQVTYGDAIKATATPLSGYVFVGWYDSETGGEKIASTNSFSGTMPASNKTIWARFQSKTVTLVKKVTPSDDFSIGTTSISSGTSSTKEFYIKLNESSIGYKVNVSVGGITTPVYFSTDMNSTFRQIGSVLNNSSSTVTVPTGFTSGYVKVTVSGGATIKIYTANDDLCTIVDATLFDIKQLGMSNTNDAIIPSNATLYSKIGKANLSGGHVSVFYLPKGFKIYNTTPGQNLLIYYKSSEFTLKVKNDSLGQATSTLIPNGSQSGSITDETKIFYTAPNSGYYALYFGTSGSVVITPPYGGVGTLQNGLPKVTSSRSSSTTNKAANGYSLGSGGTGGGVTFKVPAPKTAFIYIKTSGKGLSIYNSRNEISSMHDSSIKEVVLYSENAKYSGWVFSNGSKYGATSGLYHRVDSISGELYLVTTDGSYLLTY